MTFDEQAVFLMQSSASHDRQLGELTDKMSMMAEKISVMAEKIDVVTGNIARLVDVTNQDATFIRTLAQLVQSHDRRLSKLEEEK